VQIILFPDLPQSNATTLWTSWGNGCLASNGKYYTAIGNHQGIDGTSYVYEYDPASGSLKKIVDVAQAINQKSGDYGHGKIHAQIHEYKGSLYFASYWGKPREVEQALKKGYRGSLLFRYDLKSGKLDNLGAIANGKGLPASCLDSDRGLLYFYAVDPSEKGDLLVYDLNKQSVKFQGGAPLIGLFRSFLQAKDGRVFFSDTKGKLSFYDPGKNAISETAVILPGNKNMLRAAARPASDGRLFGMTESGRLFEFNAEKQTVKDLGPNFLNGDYTAVMALSADQKFLYFAPGAHGSAAKVGTPVIQYDISRGTPKVLAFLKDAVLKKTNYYIAGNYNLQLDPSGETLFATFNGASYEPNKKQETFGRPSLLILKIPAAERTH